MIRELVAIAGKSNGAQDGGTPVTDQARQIAEKLHHKAGDLFHPTTREGRVQVATRTVPERQSKPKKGVEGKRLAQKDPKEVIPFQEEKEDDKKVLSKF
jgi:hypothetical protein